LKLGIMLSLLPYNMFGAHTQAKTDLSTLEYVDVSQSYVEQ